MESDGDALEFEIDCLGVKSLMASEEKFYLLDVRTPDEHAIVSLPEATLIPMQEIVDRVGELEAYRQDRIVVFCHLGGRSQRVAMWLREQGFDRAQNMSGGIDAWTQQVDPALPRY